MPGVELRELLQRLDQRLRLLLRSLLQRQPPLAEPLQFFAPPALLALSGLALLLRAALLLALALPRRGQLGGPVPARELLARICELVQGRPGLVGGENLNFLLLGPRGLIRFEIAEEVAVPGGRESS